MLGVCGSIAAVKAVELARELVRHGADVIPVMSQAATRILHPDALHFATGREPILGLTGAVEHVALLGDVKGKADLLLVAPATANTVAKMAMGIDDSPVTTCATVAIGTGTPVVVAPAMHEAMLQHPVVSQHARTLMEMGVTWVEPKHEEKKAKLADVEAIVEAVIHRLANGKGAAGPLAGASCLVVSGASAEAIDDVRILTNRSSGVSGHRIAVELHRLGANVTLWQGHATNPPPAPFDGADALDSARVVPFSTVQNLLDRIQRTDFTAFTQVWMPAALGDYAPAAQKGKIPSERKGLTLELAPMPKVIEALRKAAPYAFLVAFKAESDAKTLARRAKERMKRYKADAILANTTDAFAAATTTLHLHLPRGKPQTWKGPKREVLANAVHALAPKRKAVDSHRRASDSKRKGVGPTRKGK